MCILVGLSQFCSFVLKWFDLVKRFPVKMAKTRHSCFLLDTPTPRRRAPPRRRSSRLGGPETPPKKFLLHLGVAPLCLSEPIHLGVALLRLGPTIVPVLLFLQLILESVTPLFGLSMEDN